MIHEIKTKLSIIDLAERYNAEPFGGGNVVNTKKNPLRDEKTSSLKLYRSTNTWHDFGSSEGGDVIDFYSIVNGISVPDAIRALKDELHIQGDIETVHRFVTESEYMKPAIVKKIFSQQIPIDESKHKKELHAIAPEWLYKEAHEIDRQKFFDIVRVNVQDKTANASAMVLLHDENGIERSIRYRRREIRGDMKKWVAMPDTQSSVHYTRIKDSSPFTLIVEGTHDYLTAILAGYSVIAIPSAKFKLSNELLENRLCVFIDDDDGKDMMLETFTNALCEKIWFKHADFKKIIGNETAKDFSDYLEHFSSIAEFKNAFDDFVLSSKIGDQSHFLDIIGRGLTVEMLDGIKQEAAIYDGFIYENNINMIFADGGVGKSVLSLGICNHALTHNKADMVLYIDADNGASTIKTRLPKLLEVFGEKLQYYGLVGKDREDIVAIIDKLGMIRNNNDRVMVVVDSLSFFVDGTTNDDTIIKPFMEKIKKIRDNFKATVILLHHVKKPQKEDKFPTFIGSVVIKNSCDTAWAMIRNKQKVTIKKEKARPIDAHDMFTIDIDYKNMKILSSDKVDESEVEEVEDNVGRDNEIAEEVHEFLMSMPEFQCKQSDLNDKFVGSIGKNRMYKLMRDEKYSKVLWRVFKGTNNAWMYAGIEQKGSTSPQIVEYKMENDMIIDMAGGELF